MTFPEAVYAALCVLLVFAIILAFAMNIPTAGAKASADAGWLYCPTVRC